MVISRLNYEQEEVGILMENLGRDAAGTEGSVLTKVQLLFNFEV